MRQAFVPNFNATSSHLLSRHAPGFHCLNLSSKPKFAIMSQFLDIYKNTLSVLYDGTLHYLTTLIQLKYCIALN